MDYGALIGRAWQLTTRHRFLWILGLFATSTAGSWPANPAASVNYNVGRGDIQQLPPDMARALEAIGQWFVSNWATIVAVGLNLFLLFLAWLIVSFIAQGGMARATLDLARGRATTLGQAWSAGLHFFWRYLGLWLILIGLGIAVAVVVGAVFAFGGLLAYAVESLRVVLAILGAVLLVVAAVAGIVVSVAVTIVVAYAQRAIVARDLGPWDALVAGVDLLRARLGPSLLLWLINLALGIGAAIVLGVMAVLLLIPLGGLGAVLWAVGNGFSITLGIYAFLALLAFIAVLWGVSGAINAFFWNYWTLAYLQLTAPPPGMQQV